MGSDREAVRVVLTVEVPALADTLWVVVCVGWLPVAVAADNVIDVDAVLLTVAPLGVAVSPD